MLHKAVLSRLPRLEIRVEKLKLTDVDPLDLAAAHPWGRTAPVQPIMGAVKHVRPHEAANRSERAVAQDQARLRAKAMMDEMRHPSHIEPVRLPPERRPANYPAVAPRADGEVSRAEWRDPADENRYRKEPQTIRGYRTSNILSRMMARPNSHITADHIAAADKVRLAYDVSRYGYGGPWFDPTAPRVASAGRMDHGAAAEARSAKQREIARVERVAVGASRIALFRWVVLGNKDIASWCRYQAAQNPDKPIVPKVEMGKLVGILDSLVDYYRSEIEQDKMRGETAE